MPWSPERVRAKEGLTLTDGEIQTVRAKFPKAEDGGIYIDAVFEGGGVRGVGFLGAMRCFDEVGVKLRKVAGTSAGAMMAAALASRMSQDELEATIGALDFNALLSAKNRFIWNGKPEDDMDNIGKVLANLTLVRALGQYSSQPLLSWLKKVLGDRLKTFADVCHDAGGQWFDKRELKVIASDISAGEMIVFPDDLGVDQGGFSVAEAVRLSMSIPFFFEPGNLGGRTVIDGGVLSNFPLWLYDAPVGVTPKCPTIGFRLANKVSAPKPITSALDILGAMVRTMTVAQEKRYLRDFDQGRIITIDTGDVSPTQFGIGDVEKDALYENGYTAAKRFLLEEWDWGAYLEKRHVRMGVTKTPTSHQQQTEEPSCTPDCSAPQARSEDSEHQIA